MKKRGMSVAGRAAATICFVIFVALTTFQAVLLFDMGDKGVYHYNQKEFEENQLSNNLRGEVNGLFQAYRYQSNDDFLTLCKDRDYWSADFVVYYEGKRQLSYAAKLGKQDEKQAYLYTLNFDYNYYDFAEEYYGQFTVDDSEAYTIDSADNGYLSPNEYYESYDGKKVTYDNEKAGTTYTIQVNIIAATEKNGLYQIQEYSAFVYTIRYIIWGTALLSLILSLALIGILVRKAGERRDREELHLRFRDKIPLDLYLTCWGFLLLFCAVVIDDTYYYFIRYNIAFMIGIAVLSILGAIILLNLLTSLSIRIKKGKFWKNTIIYYLLKWLRKAVRILWKKIMKSWQYVQKNIPLIWKGIAISVGFTAAEGIIFISCMFHYQDEAFVIFWIIEKLILLPAVFLVLINLHQLQKGSEQLAEGDLNHQIDTKMMFWEFKRHGVNLNHIGDGIQLAVEERMKSEHFKTELITNVSHDIKTPLTSIINYVDLLEKEEIESPHAAEYLDILKHHSLRLKKLIEDLMEASKASTGALTVHMENCDIGVMLTQAAGEFEERLSVNNLELIVRHDQEELTIRADGRHLWRIFDNLLNNIYKYSQPGTRVYLDMKKVGEMVTIIFRNTSKYALNISSEELQERFVRGDSSRNTEGSGLGISIAKSLTELMKGRFDLIIDGDLFKVVLTFPYQNSETKTAK